MTAPIHVTLRALAVLRGERTEYMPYSTVCGALMGSADILAEDVTATVHRVPTCPACAVAWDEALENSNAKKDKQR